MSLIEQIAKRVGPRRRAMNAMRIADFQASPKTAAARGVGGTDLGKLFLHHEGRLVHKWTHYLAAYDEQFRRFRAGFPTPDGTIRPLRMLEIGVSQGGSLQLWREYFGPDAIICGIDINPAVAAIDDPDLMVRVGSQDDPDFLRRIVAEMGGVDLILDDGSHVAKHQRASFETLFPMLSDGGLYAVEDLHTSYWPDFGGFYQRGGSFIEVAKQLVDDMHAWYHTKGEKLPVGASTTIPKITFYDSMVFIEKRQHFGPITTEIGTATF